MRRKIILIKQFFFFNDTATTEIYTLSLHDALPISAGRRRRRCSTARCGSSSSGGGARSEEHTSELQSQSNLVCRLLLEKKKNTKHNSPLDLYSFNATQVNTFCNFLYFGMLYISSRD